MTGRARLGAGLRTWWLARTQRERRLLATSALTLVVWATVSGVVRPLLVEREALVTLVASSEAALARLAAVPPASLGDPPQGGSISSVVARLTASLGLTILRIEPIGDGVEVLMDEAPFADLIAFVEELSMDTGLHVVRAEMDRRQTDGMVAARLTVAP